MRRLTANPRVRIAAFSIGAAIGLAMAVAGQESERATGWLIGIASSGFLASEIAGARERSRAMPPRIDVIQLPGGDASPALVLPSRVGKARTSLFMATMAICGLIALLVGSEFATKMQLARWGFVAVGLYFGLVLVTAPPRWRATEMMVALTPSGVLVHGLGMSTFTRWSAISRITRREFLGTPVVGIEVNDPTAIERYGHAASWYSTALDRRYLGADLGISVESLPVDADTFVRMVERYAEHPDERARIGQSSEIE